VHDASLERPAEAFGDLELRARMVMAVVGWGDLPNLVIEEPDGEQPR
jgi:hypothetical protein